MSENYKFTIEEKAKAYDEALSVAQETYTTQPMYRDWLAKMFPELVESENERIRQGLINGFNECLKDCPYPQNAVKYWHGIDINQILTWLEKQREQKQTWEPDAAQLIVIKDLIEEENTSKVNKVILRGMLDEFKQYFKL